MNVYEHSDTPFSRARTEYLKSIKPGFYDVDEIITNAFQAGWAARANHDNAKKQKTEGTPQPNEVATFESELKSLINRFSKEGGSDTPDFILCEFLINALNIFDISTNQRRNWHAMRTVDNMRGCPKPDALKSKEERKAETLREINKTPYGAALGKNGPEIVAGLKFSNVHMPGFTIHVLTVDKQKNQLFVQINPPESHGVHPWTEDWNLQHTRWGFERGEYWEVKEQKFESPFDSVLKAAEAFQKSTQLDAHKARTFPVGGVYESKGAFEARKQINKHVTDALYNKMRKKAGREIMEDIEQKTSETLHGFKQTFEYVPTDLLQEFNQTNTKLAKLWADGQSLTQEYKDLQNQANALANCMSRVKKEAIEKEAADKMARMVSDVMQVVDGFVKAAKAIQVFNKEAKEADATRAKLGHMNGEAKTGGPIKDLNDINLDTQEGRLLMAALAKISTESQRDKTPWEVIAQLNELKAYIFDENGTAERAWDALQARAMAELQEKEQQAATGEGVQCVKCGAWYRKGGVCAICFIEECGPDQTYPHE